MNIPWGLICVMAFASLSSEPMVWAAPAPLDPEELVRLSDLVVEVDVLSVTKAGTRDAPYWRAELRVLRVVKGKTSGNVICYDFTPPTRGLAGEKNFSVFAGERLRMHLVFEHGKYVGWAQNSNEPLSDLPERLRVLPDRLGQVIRENIQGDGATNVARRKVSNFARHATPARSIGTLISRPLRARTRSSRFHLRSCSFRSSCFASYRRSRPLSLTLTSGSVRDSYKLELACE